MGRPAFHPLVERWFSETFAARTPAQEAGWAAIASGRDTLIAAPTGSGKTLAAFLWAVNGLVTAATAGTLTDETSVVYVSPLKALGNDIHKNLTQPLAAVRKLAEEAGTPLPEIRVAVRSGDTPAAERNLMVRRPPHILITTPESLYILLTAERSRAFLATCRTVIVDEIHAVAGDKRGAHLALSLERLDALEGGRRQRIGLSATQKPIEDIARLLVGTSRVDGAGAPDCAVIDVGHRRDWQLAVEVPSLPLGPIVSHEQWEEVYGRMVELVEAHRSTLIFVNTRALVERVSHQLEARLGEGKVGAHHGSLSRKTRLAAEEGLKSGSLRAVVATASLELGIDIGHVDLVVHLGPPRALATMLQRIGRSGHWIGGTPKGVLFPLTRDELVQCAAAVQAARAGELDRVIMPAKPIDILAQQIVATAASGPVAEEELWAMARRAYPYRELTRAEFDQVILMLSEGFSTRRGRASAHLHRDQVNGLVSGRRGARLAAITCGGAIPDTADYDVIAEPDEVFVGKLNEDFAIESSAGDVFLLGNTSWRVRRVESGKVRVVDAQGAPPSVPFWFGEAPARTAELSHAVARLRAEVAGRLGDRAGAIAWLCEAGAVNEAGAVQIVDYVAETVAALGVVPTQDTVVAERFFDEGGGMQLVLHTPFGGRINRAWGLSLRKRFCVNFDFELQAAATDDGVVLSLGEQHSFPLDSVFAFLRPATLRETLIQAVLPSPIFGNRWRWNATRGLALLRYSGGRKVPPQIMRMRSDDLLASVFPDQVACQENRSGPIPIPDHPLVNETVANCLQEAMDLQGLIGIVQAMERGEIRGVAVETPAPSPMSHEILNANPYAFLDDAPLEERRARAVSLRRTDPELAGGAGALSPVAIQQVREDAWPDVRHADELHDVLLSAGVLPAGSADGWDELLATLAAAGRTRVARWSLNGLAYTGVVAAERVGLAAAAFPGIAADGSGPDPGARWAEREWQEDDALRSVVGAWMQMLGPVTASGLSERLGLAQDRVDRALMMLEASGAILRGRFTAVGSGDDGELEWCERRLLARIHRLTLRRLRAEIEPVSPAVLMRFLQRWGHVAPGTQLHGREGLLRVIEQLQGLELPAPAWEERIFPARVRNYDPGDLEQLCLSGVVAWGRLVAPGATGDLEDEAEEELPIRVRRPGPVRNSPLAFVLREDLPTFVGPLPAAPGGHPAVLDRLPAAAQEVAGYLASRGASFLTDIARGTKRMPSEVEDALWELVSAGLVSGDGVAGLRQLLSRNKPAGRHTRLRAIPGVVPSRSRPLPVGRWSLWRDGALWARPEASPEEQQEAVAKQLLRRYGVVFRDLLTRERTAPPWRVLLGVYRRMEARGEIRGGRFVNGFVGEQFALPEAVESLRAVRRSGDDGETLILHAPDPLNLAGIIVPGARVSPFSTLAVAYRNGAAVDAGPLGALRSRLYGRHAAGATDA